MVNRRSFMKGVAAAGVGAGAAKILSSSVANAEDNTQYKGPFKMLKNAKILAIKNADGIDTMGVVTPKGVIDIRAVARKLNIKAPYTLEGLLHSGNADAVQQVIDGADKSQVAYLDESKIKHGQLFKNPSQIICIGLNYSEHVAETGMNLPKVPILFNKYNNALAGHNCVIKLPPKEVSYKFDYETEMLIVVGKKMRNVPMEKTLDYVAGYCTSHDFSARDLQLETPSVQWMIGKTLDNFGPIGPYFVSADQVKDPNDLSVQTWVNGEMRQNSNTKYFIHNTQKILSYISTFWALNPGDVIYTGTPSGVIIGMPKEKQVWLKAGDKIKSKVGELGTLEITLA
jgi:2-keto-4-pentenoate hydratase/2-oxohepta-3-ene-1,7-dioic acid hydratase in catechol pathway